MDVQAWCVCVGTSALVTCTTVAPILRYCRAESPLPLETPPLPMIASLGHRLLMLDTAQSPIGRMLSPDIPPCVVNRSVPADTRVADPTQIDAQGRQAGSHTAMQHHPKPRLAHRRAGGRGRI
eukprot:GHVU01116138.1.p2 GENE.GHVU01116138.1~~GHVU01116138.1.p2  ORF type:complete len:123 (+),score=6.24 GHVU01116138.1:265-633(+)